MDTKTAKMFERIGILTGVVKTVRWGDHVTIRYWNLYDDSDYRKYIDYLQKNRNVNVTKTFFLDQGCFRWTAHIPKMKTNPVSILGKS